MAQELYELPEGWEWFSVKNLSSKVQYGHTTKAREKGNAQFLRITDIQNGQIQWDEVPFVDVSDEELEKYRLHVDDLVFARSGATSGKSILIITPPKNSIFASYLIRVVPNINVVFPKFLELFFQSPVYWKQVDKNISGAAQPNINGTKLSRFQVTLAPLNEQKRIVAKLDALFTRIDTAISHLQQTLELSKALFASALDEVMQSNSEGWEKTTIREVSTKVSTGPFGSMLHKSDYISNGIPLVNPVNIIKGKIVPDHKKNVTEEMKSRLQSYVISAGDIVLARRGEIGRCAVVTDSESGWICGTGCFFLTPKRNVNPEFLANLIRSSTYKMNLEGVATGATIKNISNRLLSDFSFSLPSLGEQNRIVAHLDALSQRTRTLEATTQEKFNYLIALKASLLDAAFKGQL